MLTPILNFIRDNRYYRILSIYLLDMGWWGTVVPTTPPKTHLANQNGQYVTKGYSGRGDTQFGRHADNAIRFRTNGGGLGH